MVLLRRDCTPDTVVAVADLDIAAAEEGIDHRDSLVSSVVVVFRILLAFGEARRTLLLVDPAAVGADEVAAVEVAGWMAVAAAAAFANQGGVPAAVVAAFATRVEAPAPAVVEMVAVAEKAAEAE